MRTEFIIPGEPKAKGRPRVIRKGEFSKAYTPKDTVMYENLVRLEYETQCKGKFFEKGIPLKMYVTAYHSIPKSTSKKKTQMMLEGILRPLKKPDSSNILKAIEDSLNTVAYHDDAQIVETIITRYYSEKPCVKVIIEELEEEK